MPDSMLTVVDLRPVRLALFILPNDPTALLNAIELCTIVWGGLRNPILPLVSGSRSMFKAERQKRPAAEEVISGFVNTFEPDVVVTTEPACFGERRTASPLPTVSLADALVAARIGEPLHGLSVVHAYEHLYQSTFRFVQRNPIAARPSGV